MSVLSGSGPAEAPSGGFRGSPSALPISSEATAPSAVGRGGVTTTGETGTGPQSPALAHLVRPRPSPRWAPSVHPSCLWRPWGATAAGGTSVSTRGDDTFPGVPAAPHDPLSSKGQGSLFPSLSARKVCGLSDWECPPGAGGGSLLPGGPGHPLASPITLCPPGPPPSPGSDTLTHLGQPSPQVTSIKPWEKWGPVTPALSHTSTPGSHQDP